MLSRSIRLTACLTSAAASGIIAAICEKEHPTQQPHFIGATNLRSSTVKPKKVHRRSLNDMAIVTGTAHKDLAVEISNIIGIPLANAKMARFSDGEVSVEIKDSVQGKTVFIVQPCAMPVNDSIMELLLAISCAKRAAAARVIAVIPYFGYKHHRRGTPISTTSHSRFLSSSAMDFARMLQEVGVDHVITVDLQRPGQGHEACFFGNSIPLETILTRQVLVDHFVHHIPLNKSVVVISPNTECVKKAKNFQVGLKKALPELDVHVAVFDQFEIDSSEPTDPNTKILLGNVQIEDSDVVIVDDLVDTAGTLSVLSTRLHQMGAKNIYVCASHGLFTDRSMEVIRNAPVQKVIVTNTLRLPPNASDKVIQVSIAPMLSQLILMEHFRRRFEEDQYEIDKD